MPAQQPTARPSVTVKPTAPKEGTLTSGPGAKGAVKVQAAPGQADGQTVSDATASKSVDVSQCGVPNEGKTRKCQLAKGHPLDPKLPNGGHKFRVQGTGDSTVSLRDAAGAEFSLEDASDDVKPGEVKVQVKEVTRDKDQLWMDEQVKASYAAWVEAGKPNLFNDSPRKRIRVPAAAVPAVRKMLTSSGSFLDKRVRIAQPVTEDDGRVAVYYVATDRTAAKGKAKPKGDTKADAKPESKPGK
jgi:hypothetical protein